ncbi:hypothetical protein [Sulfurimonas autotrophica]|uniref:Copper resistance protein D domain-containing protein n=1 Tax=Sulfurimonas autotrophica (strain ATCC BAA-671 / DSM 16294 / JCM 11897 / OK10) TaxID=563040 RepID=E0UTY5_SULAO|nr:hypothetical protein [Sulfurimonas autotrophica]ADN09429.1 conserved hypothetical protein [Sulfurimonas autotrophica DSM 16294]
MGLFIHIHLIAAIAWIGGSIFMFVLGVTLLDKEKQKQVYPHIGPIFGYFELVSIVVLLLTGTVMIVDNGLYHMLLTHDDNIIVQALRKKLFIVAIIVIATIIHFFIAFRTNGKERTKIQNIISRGSSLLIFFLNLFVLHYAIMIRAML